MKTFGHTILVLVIFFLLLSTTLSAESQDPADPVAQHIAGVPQEQLQAGLPSTIKIDQSILRAKIVHLSSAFYAAWNNIKNSCNQLETAIANFENEATIYINKSNECKAKIYTQQDMTMAGCTSSDTLQACSTKLYKWCIAAEDLTLAGRGLPISTNLQMIKSSSDIANQEYINSLDKFAP